MSTESIPSSVRQALRSDISRLEDECFGDLPIIQQRIMKSHAMMDNKETYIYNKISPEKTDNLKYLPDNSPQVQNAQKLVDNIVKRMVNGNSAASEYLKNFMSDKKIKAHIINQPIMDACCNGLDNKTKELHLSFCSGCFMYQKNNPDFANEDTFAVTVGHEIGHAIEQENQGCRNTFPQ